MYEVENNRKNRFGNSQQMLVNDWFYEDISFQVPTACNYVGISICKYINVLKKISENVIVSGETHDALVSYMDLFDTLANNLVEIGSQYRTLCWQFIKAVDDADDIIYEKSASSDLTRDFSAEQEKTLRLFVPDEDSPYFPNLGWAHNAFFYCADKYADIQAFFDESKKNSDAYLVTLANYNNMCKGEIKRIFDNVRTVDVIYAEKFGELHSQFTEIIELINEAKQIVSKKDGFTKVSINNLINRAEKIHITDHKLIILNEHFTREEADEFVKNHSNKYFYQGYYSDLNDAIRDIGVLDTIGMIVYQGKAIAKSTLIEAFEVPTDVHMDDAYEYLLIKKHLSETISEMGGDGMDFSQQSAQQKNAKKIIDSIVKGKKNFPGYEEYKKLYDFLGDTWKDMSKSIDLGLEFADIIIPIFATYIENQKIIESLANGIDENSLMGIAVRELHLEYTEQYLASIPKYLGLFVSEAMEYSIGELKDELLKLVGKNVASLYKAVDLGVKITGELTGLSDASSSQIEFMVLSNSNAELQAAYQYNFDKIASGDYTDTDILNLENSFKLLKNAYVKEFDLLSNAAGANGEYDKKMYYDYLSKFIERRTINDIGTERALSFEAFMAQ